MFVTNSRLYPSPRNPCRHKSVWPLRRTGGEDSSDITRSAMATAPTELCHREASKSKRGEHKGTISTGAPLPMCSCLMTNVNHELCQRPMVLVERAAEDHGAPLRTVLIKTSLKLKTGKVDLSRALTYPKDLSSGSVTISWMADEEDQDARGPLAQNAPRSAGRVTGPLSAERIGGPSGTRAWPVKAKERLAMA